MDRKHVGATLIVISLLIFGFSLVQFPPEENTELNNLQPDNSSPESGLRAALIDSLYVSNPNNQFTSNLTVTLNKAGFKVDVYQGRKVTVDFLKALPDHYDLLVLRMHSAVHSKTLGLYLFTAEPYDQEKHVEEQYFHLVKKAVAFNDTQPVFAVNSWFIKKCMNRMFNGTLVIVMGCDGTCDTSVAEEFFRQGAVGYMGWNGLVVPMYSDQAILRLIINIYFENFTLQQAVEKTNEQLNPDPSYNSTLELLSP